MKIENEVQEKIDKVAKKRISHLHINTFSFEIKGSIHAFRDELSTYNLIIEDLDEVEFTHSEKIPMESDIYFQLRDIAKFIAAYFSSEHRYVTNQKHGDGIIFIGHVNNIYAAQIAFHCLAKIVLDTREVYMSKLKRYKKQSTKDEHADDYMDEWLDDLIGSDRYNDWNDPDYHEDFEEYVKNNFKTSEDKNNILRRAIDITKPMFNPKLDESLTWGEFKKELFKIFPEELINQSARDLEEIQTKDIVMLFYSDRPNSNNDD